MSPLVGYFILPVVTGSLGFLLTAYLLPWIRRRTWERTLRNRRTGRNK